MRNISELNSYDSVPRRLLRRDFGDAFRGRNRRHRGFAANGLSPWLAPWAIILRSTSFDAKHFRSSTLMIPSPAGCSAGISAMRFAGVTVAIEALRQMAYPHGSRHGLLSCALVFVN
jgi:hypothetical protein